MAKTRYECLLLNYWHRNKAVDISPIYQTLSLKPNTEGREKKTGKVAIKTHPSIKSSTPNCYCQQPFTMFFRSAEQAPFTPTTYSSRKRGALDNGEHTARRRSFQVITLSRTIFATRFFVGVRARNCLFETRVYPNESGLELMNNDEPLYKRSVF